jgi:hypothetical protein
MKIETDDELDVAVARVDELLIYRSTPEEEQELEELSDAIYEFEKRTDILNRNYRI